MESPRGPNNIGLLVRVTGRVSASGGGMFLLSDGSGSPVKCILPEGAAIPPDGVFANVAGISSCENDGGGLRSVIRIPSESNISLMTD